jgi:glycine oxidase
LKDHNSYDHIIIGQGLAGSVLAIALHRRGKRVIVLDDGHRTSASVVAAGLVNPVALKRMIPSWRASELLPVAERFYREAESLLGSRFYHPREILKPFSNEEEIRQWKENASKPVGEYLSQEIVASFQPAYYKAPLGCGVIKQGASLSCTVFLEAAKRYFLNHSLLVNEEFSFDNLKVNKGEVTYKDYTARSIIFCEGYRAIYNPYFSWLPFRLTKGELIEVHIPGLETGKVVNKGVFVLQKRSDSYRVGATYEWNSLDTAPSPEAKQELCEKLEKIMHHAYAVTDQKAGIRPTVKDHRPFIGVAPGHPGVYIFNGMGSKGVMLAPFFAEHLADHLEDNIPLDPESDISRYYSEGRQQG